MKDERPPSLTRRRALGLAAGTVATALSPPEWVFALSESGSIIKKESELGANGWRPVLFDEHQAEAVARLCETIIPRTDTPGARDARVHEYIDLAVSLADDEDRESFLEGLTWLDKRCRRRYDRDLVTVPQPELEELLHSISDEHQEHRRRLRKGATFFVDLKERTIFGYYTSLTGRVEELGLPDIVTMETWRGCRHPEGTHR